MPADRSTLVYPWMAIAEFRYPFALVSTGASAAALSTASTGATSTAAKAGIWFRIYDQSIEEQIDRVRHNLDGIQRGVIECVSRTLNQRE